MNIAQIKGLDIGMSGISCSGEVKYENEPRNITGTHNNKPYSFWTQFVIIEDTTDSIGVNLKIGNADQRREKGQIISIEKGVLDSYEKDGETKLSLKGNLVKTSAQQQGQQGSQQAAQGPKGEDKAVGMVRHGVVCAAIQAGQIVLRENNRIPDINYWVEYIMTGKAPLPPKTQNNGQSSEENYDDVPDF